MSESDITFKPNGFRVYSALHEDEIGTIYWDDDYKVWGFFPNACQPNLFEGEIETILNKVKEMNQDDG